jgi:predicted TIM-barrel fold metal-dependent hydrolase
MQELNRQHRAPARPLPAGAADCHMHVFGPLERFPLAAQRSYNVSDAPLAAHERMKRQVGLERTVFVQASGYGTDNRAMLAALAELGSRGRGVAVVEPDAPKAELERLHAAGVRGMRVNLQTLPGRYSSDRAGVISLFARLVAPLGWHLQIFCDPATLVALEPTLMRSPVETVIDHMGLPDARAGLDQPGFQAVLRLLRSARAWVKVAGADRITRHTGRLRDAVPFIRALAQAAPERVVWGSDWPNIGFHAGAPVLDGEVLPFRELDAGELLDVLGEAVPDASARATILSGNPEKLYDF